MSEFESMNHEQEEFARSLQQLRPVEPELDVAELMFRAGQDSAWEESQRQLRRWQFSTLVTSACAVMAVITLWPVSASTPASETSIAHETIQPEPKPDESIAEKQIPVREERTPEAIVDVEQPKLQPHPLNDWWNRQFTVSATTEDSYLDLRNRILQDGIDALPEPKLGGGSSSGEPLTASPLRLRDALNQDLWNQI